MNYERRDIFTKAGKKRIEVRYWSGTGENRVELRRRFKTSRDANFFIDDKLSGEIEAKRDLKRDGPDQLKARSFGEEFEFWHEVRLPDWSPGWLVSVNQFMRDFGDSLRNAKIAEIRPEYLKRLEAGLRKRGDGFETIRHKIGMIKTVLNHSVEMERIPYNPVARYRLPKGQGAEIGFWDSCEVRSFLDFAQAKYPDNSSEYGTFVIYVLVLNTAVRAGELWALRPDSLRPSFNAIQLTEQFHAVSKSFRPLKGKQGRQVPMSPGLLAVLDLWIKQRGINRQELLFTNRNGNPVDHNNFYDRVFLKDVAEWGGRRIKFHGLRHTAATLMLDQGVNIRTLQRILGHKDLETTEGYVHALGRKIQEAAVTFSLMPTVMPSQLPTDGEPVNRRHLSIVR